MGRGGQYCLEGVSTSIFMYGVLENLSMILEIELH